ncbi:MAG: ceramide glucosyltransferase [Alphaproteobacteria bacterium]|jgi:ceramide glucosyltransferase|nr:ceramide glucosyltransferase [Alphaproteobacteria bacterium]
MMLFWLSVTASLVAVAGCGFLLTATMLVARAGRSTAHPRAVAVPAVTILKPLHGDEPGLFANLGSFCSQDYPGPIQVVFGVQDPGDGAVAVVEHLQKTQAGRDLDLVIETKVHGLNRKVSNLVNMAPHIRHDVVVLADSDMRVEPDYLSRVTAALGEPGVGAVTCLYFGVPVAGMWSSLSALAINAHFLPGVVFGSALGLARPCFGSTLALRRQTLGEIGGFIAFVDCLADDYAMGAALRARGHTISIPPFAVAHICTEASARDFWRHELRWARTIKSIDPLGYAGSILAHPLPWALIAALLGAGSAAFLPAIAIALASIGCRVALLRQVERAYALPPQAYWLVPARDLLSFILFVVSFFGRDVSWKGHRYRMVAGGSWVSDRGSHAP